MGTISPERLKELLARARQKNPVVAKAMENLHPNTTITVQGMESHTNEETDDAIKDIVEISSESGGDQGIGRTGEAITYNEKQLEFITVASKGESAVLIGAAGTGKTTCMQGVMRDLIQSGIAGILESDGHKYLPAAGVPGIVVVSFTRRAVNNIRRVMPENMKGNCITIHKLLEYEPVFYEIYDSVSGEMKKTMRFEPSRNRLHPLSRTIKTIAFEESSMCSVELHQEVQDALPHSPQSIYLGDIQQLPPVFGSAILGYKMLELPVTELTEVYRQALESPIIRLAHRILSGNPIPASEYPDWAFPNQLTIHPWKKKLSPDTALLTAAKFFTVAIDAGAYDPDEDMILVPFNKSCGTDELNKHIAQHLARKENKIVWEIIAGFNKVYLAVGDKVLVDKEDAIITKITRNASYLGKRPQHESVSLDYWGHNHDAVTSNLGPDEDVSDADMDFLLEQAANANDEERVKIASHIVDVKLLDSERELTIDSAGAVNAMVLSYALTVHKSQGSEWRKVFILFHQSHATMLQRELLYTAVTRAKEELYVICEPETFTNGIRSQRIKGNTLAEKAEFFKGKLADKGGELLAAETAMSRAVDKAEKHIAAIEAKMQTLWDELTPEEKDKIPFPRITYEKDGAAAGRAFLNSGRININPIYLAQHPEDSINQTLPHEFAHICAWKMWKDSGHNYYWESYCKKFGIPPNRYHYNGKMGKNLSDIMNDEPVKD